jgi:hypothetical protein
MEVTQTLISVTDFFSNRQPNLSCLTNGFVRINFVAYLLFSEVQKVVEEREEIGLKVEATLHHWLTRETLENLQAWVRVVLLHLPVHLPVWYPEVGQQLLRLEV